jgi:hypothetical protein
MTWHIQPPSLRANASNAAHTRVPVTRAHTGVNPARHPTKRHARGARPPLRRGRHRGGHCGTARGLHSSTFSALT